MTFLSCAFAAKFSTQNASYKLDVWWKSEFCKNVPQLRLLRWDLFIWVSASVRWPINSGSKVRAAGDDDISALHFDGVTLGGSAAGAKSKSHKGVCLESFLLQWQSQKRSLSSCWAEGFTNLRWATTLDWICWISEAYHSSFASPATSSYSYRFRFEWFGKYSSLLWKQSSDSMNGFSSLQTWYIFPKCCIWSR